MQSDDLHAIEGWLGGMLASLKPGERKRFAIKVMRLVRRENVGRISRNEEPDGGSMAPRKSRLDRSGKVERRGKMFRKIRLLKNLKIKASPDGGELHFVNPLIEKTAAIHHFGEEGRVGKTRDGRTIRTRYAARRLLGFGNKERDAILDLAVDHLKS